MGVSYPSGGQPEWYGGPGEAPQYTGHGFVNDYGPGSSPSYADTPNGASSIANQLSQAATGFQGRQPPNPFANPYDAAARNQGLADRQQQLAALQLTQQQANGTAPNPAADAARAAIGQTQTQNTALARSAGWGRGALANRASNNSSVTAGVTGGQNVAALNAQQQLAAQQRYQQGLQGLAKQGQQQQGLEAEGIENYANLYQQNQAENDAMQAQYQGYAQQAMENQLQADTATYADRANALGAQQRAQNQINAQQQQQATAATEQAVGDMFVAAGGASVAADMHLREPGGAAHWSLREEPSFILARNERTGELRKVATQPLSRPERHQAMAPHGAGPLGSYGPGTREAGDLQLGANRMMPMMGYRPPLNQVMNQSHPLAEGGKGVQMPMQGPVMRPNGSGSMGPMMPPRTSFGMGQPAGQRMGGGPMGGGIDPNMLQKKHLGGMPMMGGPSPAWTGALRGAMGGPQAPNAPLVRPQQGPPMRPPMMMPQGGPPPQAGMPPQQNPAMAGGGMPGVGSFMSDERAKITADRLMQSPPAMGQGESVGRSLLAGTADPNRNSMNYMIQDGLHARPEHIPPMSIMSDERVKEFPEGQRTEERFDRTPYDYAGHSAGLNTVGEPSEADHFLAHLHPHAYRYKDPSYEPSSSPTGGHYLGVMAQDVERSPFGPQIVKNTPHGKMLEGPALLSAVTGGLGRLHERVSALEGARRY